MSTHEIQTYVDKEGQHRWRVLVKGVEGSAVEDNIVADSGQGYHNKDDMLKSFFGIFFGDWNDSFLAAYNEWHPEMGQVTVDDITAREEPVEYSSLDRSFDDNVGMGQ